MKIMCNVAGITFRNGGEEFTKIRPEGIVTFIHDPTNKHDPNAVEVHYGSLHIGYVKRDSYAQEFLKDNPDVCEAEITDYSYSEKETSSDPTGRTCNGLTFNRDHKGRLGSLSFVISNGDSNVTLDEDNNYIVDGVAYIRLSNVAKHFDPEPDSPGLDTWKIDHKDYADYRRDLNERARAGTAIHNVIDAFIKSGQTDVLIPVGFFNFVKKFEIMFEGSEIFMFNPESGIAGTGDAKAFAMDGKKGQKVKKKVLIDWKSSKKPTKKHALTTSWYGVEQDVDEAWVVAFGGDTKQGFSLMKIGNDKMKRLHAIIENTKESIDLMRG